MRRLTIVMLLVAVAVACSPAATNTRAPTPEPQITPEPEILSHVLEVRADPQQLTCSGCRTIVEPSKRAHVQENQSNLGNTRYIPPLSDSPFQG
jgi:hypothetical protein